MRNRFHLPPQILRLCLLVVGIVVSYSIARYFLTPPSFRQYGWYRGEALAEIATRDRMFAGRKACDECHSDEVQKLAKFGHKSLSCEGCHGPGQAHSDNPSKDNIEKNRFGVCLRCHEENPSRPKWHKQIALKTHYSGKCIECHVPHAPSETP